MRQRALKNSGKFSDHGILITFLRTLIFYIGMRKDLPKSLLEFSLPLNEVKWHVCHRVLLKYFLVNIVTREKEVSRKWRKRKALKCSGGVAIRVDIVRWVITI